MLYIADQSSFAAFCERSRGAEVLAIDTEFLREKTYYAKLCLLQLATDDEVAVVDPFALRTLDDLVPLLQDPGCTKLFHSGTQDIEILYRETGALPVGVFDTQVAAALLGHTQQIGYGALVHDVCGVTIRKLDSFTDWSRRPLAKSQIEYASEDVIYLPRMYRAMRERLVELGRLEWLAPDFQELVDPKRFEAGERERYKRLKRATRMYRAMRERLVELGRLEWLAPDFQELVDPKRFEAGERERYKRLKRANQLSQRQLAGAREFAAWREVTAQTRNLPRKWVATDEQIVEACKREARTIDDLFMVRGLSGKLSTAEARTVARLMAQAFDSDPSAHHRRSVHGAGAFRQAVHGRGAHRRAPYGPGFRLRPLHLAQARPVRAKRAQRGFPDRPHDRAGAASRQAERRGVPDPCQPRRHGPRGPRLPRRRGPSAGMAALLGGRGACRPCGGPAVAVSERAAPGGPSTVGSAPPRSSAGDLGRRLLLRFFHGEHLCES